VRCSTLALAGSRSGGVGRQDAAASYSATRSTTMDAYQAGFYSGFSRCTAARRHRPFTPPENLMNHRTPLAVTLLAAALLAFSGCAVTRGQETVGAYMDDATITATVKARFVENKSVDAGAIKVETLNGTILLSGFAQSVNERLTAEDIANKVVGAKKVRNEIAVRP
jgi:hypothetical protein